MPSNAPRTPSGLALLATACALAIGALTAHFEGLVTHPNPDPGNPKVQQVCYGDTEIPMHNYTPDECAVLLSARQQRNYAPAVLKCVPGFADGKRINAFAASIDAAYNAGTAAFCRSPMARRFNAGDWAGGCNTFPGWYVTANRKPLRGLVRRRAAERTLCLKSAG